MKRRCVLLCLFFIRCYWRSKLFTEFPSIKKQKNERKSECDNHVFSICFFHIWNLEQRLPQNFLQKRNTIKKSECYKICFLYLLFCDRSSTDYLINIIDISFDKETMDKRNTRDYMFYVGYLLHKELHRIYLHLSYFTRFPFNSSRQYCQISFINHIAFSFNKETKNNRSVGDDIFSYQIIHVTSQDFLSIAVDKYLLWISQDFPFYSIGQRSFMLPHRNFLQ